ncbi:GDSL-type esterase/lipase family protein [Methylobacterium sp. NEAU 140]|uniref:GDSL-type esterase/lipase family protein n=1 Tax=Methylobacterium sp. NEAU 140 TaxID=3064945 RepID=UPI00273608BD|nr:GDSL-type esterase/lipase family protein [Methylobacterium sp. NEAU 140]MDP4024789.1 GDSL-type esterase/lipase family protein [Methylobacterium sp. NEAU 140]
MDAPETAPPVAVPPIVFIGDSITEQWSFYRAGTFEAYGLIPRGVSGETAGWVARRFRGELERSGARGVHLLCGVNDIGRNGGVFVSTDEIVATLLGMLDEARALGVKAWVGSITPAANIPWNPGVPDAPAMIDAVNVRLRAEAPAHGATFIDYYAVLADGSGGLRTEYGSDGLHLSPAGYAAIEPLMLTALGRIAPPATAATPAPAAPEAPARTAFGPIGRTGAAALAALAALVVLVLLALAVARS